MCYVKIYIKVYLMLNVSFLVCKWIEIKFEVESKFKMAAIAKFVG